MSPAYQTISIFETLRMPMEDDDDFRAPRRIRVFLLENTDEIVILRTRDG